MRYGVSFFILLFSLCGVVFSEQISVTSFNNEFLVNRVHKIVEQQFSDVQDLKISARVKNKDMFSNIPQDSMFVSVDFSKPDTFLGKLLLDVVFLSDQNEVLSKEKCFLEVQASALAYASSRKLQPHEKIDEADLVLKRVQLDSRYRNFMFDKRHIVGKQTTRTMLKGIMFSNRWVEVVPDVDKGDSLKVVVASPGFEIRYDAVALESGVVGDIIRLRSQAKKVVRGEIRNDKSVLVRTF